MALASYLEKTLGLEVELIVTTDYTAMIEAMRRGNIDVGYFGPVSYVLLKSRFDGVKPFVAKKDRDGSLTYYSIIIAGADTPIKTLADIRGKTVAFGDPASTSSNVIPKLMLIKDGGLKPEQDFKSVYLGAHDAVAIAVMRGHADAGGLGKHIFDSLVQRGLIDLNKVRIIKVSDPIPQYPFVMRTDLPKELQDRIKQAFLNLDNKEVLEPLKAYGFGTITDQDYDIIRDAVRFLQIDLTRGN
jgi:phosphonate transport system substrate-binding protein